MVDRNRVRRAFGEVYRGAEPRLFSAPGRVNLIGEHTDYNDGFVLPMAIDREVVVAAKANDTRSVRVHSLNINQTAEFDLDNPGPKLRGLWIDYVEGMAQSLIQSGKALAGADMLLLSDVPSGAGLSSSAALEISTGLALIEISNAGLDKVELALAGQRAEHVYVGTMCGIMDQLVAACAEEGHALLVDCRSLEMTQIPIDTTETVIAICDTGVKHELASSEYNTRRMECERGVEILKSVLPEIRALRDVSVEEFERHKGLLPEPVRSRCRHVVTENARTLAAAAALNRSDFEELGRLMRASHESLRVDYEVSCAELDVMVEIASAVRGVYGARMTGGGFGGSTVNLVRKDAVKEFQAEVFAGYNKRTGKLPTIYISEPGAGAREITE
jgi:galactokinase